MQRLLEKKSATEFETFHGLSTNRQRSAEGDKFIGFQAPLTLQSRVSVIKRSVLMIPVGSK